MRKQEQLRPSVASTLKMILCFIFFIVGRTAGAALTPRGPVPLLRFTVNSAGLRLDPREEGIEQMSICCGALSRSLLDEPK